MLSKTETVWRHLLADYNPTGQRRWPSITALAHTLELPISTTHKALAAPVRTGAVKVHSAGLVQLLDPYRLAVLWAGRRRLDNDLLTTCHIPIPVTEIERDLTATGCILGAFTAVVAHRGYNGISDYTTVLAYTNNLETIPTHLRNAENPDTCSEPNTHVLIAQTDPLLANYGNITPLGQAWADLFGIADWQSTYFTNTLTTTWQQTT